MTTLTCAIYKDVSPPSQYVYYFFEAKKTDDFVFLGWAKCNRSRKEVIEIGFHKWIRIEFFPSMPKGIQEI